MLEGSWSSITSTVRVCPQAWLSGHLQKSNPWQESNCYNKFGGWPQPKKTFDVPPHPHQPTSLNLPTLLLPKQHVQTTEERLLYWRLIFPTTLSHESVLIFCNRCLHCSFSLLSLHRRAVPCSRHNFLPHHLSAPTSRRRPLRLDDQLDRSGVIV